jgi:HK97 family phage prohead protease
MDRVRKAFASQTVDLGPRQIRVICSTGEVDRTGEQVVQSGIDLSGFKANPIILWQHDPEHPIGRASNFVQLPDALQMDIEFAPEGVSKKADEICGLVKAGVLNTVSIGFDPIETEAMNPAQAGKRNAPQRYLKIDLMETSIVSIPANKDTVITQRRLRAANSEDWRCAPAKDLDIDTESDWDGRDAADRILDDAGFNGDNPDPDKAKLGFLAYDEANATLKGSYKLPFADIKNGKLVAVASGIRAAASRVSQTDIPDAVKKSAQSVIDAYEEKMAEADEKAAQQTVVKGVLRRGGAPVVKDLYDIGQLAWLLASLGYAQTSARIETALEGDNSKLPEILAGVMQDLGAALIAMTEEEVAEAIAEAQGTLGQEEQMDGLAVDDAVLVTAGSNPMVRKFRAGFYRTKASATRVKDGKKISAATADALKDALAHHDKAMEAHRETGKSLVKAAKCINDLMPPDTDATDVQTSDGDGDSGGSANGKSAEARRKEVHELRAKAA